jgi:hypothetical protein
MMATRDELTKLISDKWAVVPIAAGAKHPEHTDWPTRIYTADDFLPTQNVGVKCGEPSDWRVDVDADDSIAVKIAPHLLPKTGLVHGRPGNPSSHHWFLVPGAASTSFKGIAGKMLIEIRSTGVQTVVPPSIHATGEQLTWVSYGDAARLTPDELRIAVARVAIATLLAHCWPKGNRHNAAGAFGGFMGRCGVEPMFVKEMLRAALNAVGESAWFEDNWRFAEMTMQRLAEGQHVTGAPTLKDTLVEGALFVASTRKWLGLADEGDIEDLNERHFVACMGKDVIVGMERPDKVVFQTFGNFKQLYYNRWSGKKKLGDAWLEHAARRTYDEVVFAPPACRKPAKATDYNLWRGFACEPDPEPHPEHRIHNYLKHLRDVICDSNELHGNYVLDLLADCVQRPGAPIGKCLVLRGQQGTGKSVFVESFGRLFGDAGFVAVSSREAIVGKFNAHLAGRVVVFADEAVWGGNRQDIGTLKSLITQETMNIEPKGIDRTTVPNCVHLFMATNEEWAFPAGDYERRGVILDINKRYETTDPYWDPLWDEVRSPKFAPALLAYLLKHKVNYPRLRERLDTVGLRAQQAHSADPVRTYWHTRLEDGRLGPEGKWPRIAAGEDLWEDFRREFPTHSHMNRRLFTLTISGFLPGAPKMEPRKIKRNVAIYGVPHWAFVCARCFVLPKLQVCRDFFDMLTGTKNDWNDAPDDAPLLHDEDLVSEM